MSALANKFIARLSLAAGILASGLVALGVAHAFCASATEDGLPVVMEGCRNAAAAISSGRGKITVHDCTRHNNGGELETRTTYDLVFRNGSFKVSSEKEYLKNTLPVPANAALLGPGTVLKRQISCGNEQVVSFRMDDGKALIEDPDSREGRAARYEYTATLMLGILPGLDPVNMDQFVKQAPGTTSSPATIVGGEVIDGNECLIVEKSQIYPVRLGSDETMKGTWWFWVDPQKGYRIPRINHWVEGGLAKEKMLVFEINTELRQYGDGAWGPAKITRDSYARDPKSGETYKKLRRVTTIAPDFAFNSPVGDEDLLVSLPSGTKVVDAVSDAKYVVP